MEYTSCTSKLISPIDSQRKYNIDGIFKCGLDSNF